MRVGDAGTMDETERPPELSPDHREEDSDPSASAIAQDATFSAAMRRAIEKGLEHAPICIERRPGTKRPILIPVGWARGLKLPVMPGQRPRLQQDPPSPSQTRAEVPPAVER
jgi:hypothetical protein